MQLLWVQQELPEVLMPTDQTEIRQWHLALQQAVAVVADLGAELVPV
jgi:hypothetical protein